ncbi:MAG: histidine phosphatase family protein [Synechococcales bacterium]|nr:histidine phosphatase family protein [Synechococcales bacterium]
MSLKLYLLRHGETTLSRTGGYCGALDPELTPAGLQMAQAFAEAYRTIPWAGVYVSPMKRAIATAKPLCEAINIDMQIREGLQEIHFGEWEGKSTDEVKQQYEEDYVRWLTEPAWNPPTGGETAVELASRASLVIAEIEEKHRDGNVLVVSHKATIRVILCSLLGIDLGRYRDRITTLVASVCVVRFGIHGPLLETLGDRYHLPPYLRELPGT